MSSPVDLCIREKTQEVLSKAEQLGWEDPEGYSTEFLRADDWGELKRKIRQNREKADILVFEGRKEKLIRKAASEGRIDVILSPGRERDDCGIDEVIAEKASENNVAIALSLRDIASKNRESQYRTFSNWRKLLEICEDKDADYILTTEAREVHHLRASEDMKNLLNSLGFSGENSIAKQGEILEKNLEKKKEEHLRGGVKRQ